MLAALDLTLRYSGGDEVDFLEVVAEFLALGDVGKHFQALFEELALARLLGNEHGSYLAGEHEAFSAEVLGGELVQRLRLEVSARQAQVEQIVRAQLDGDVRNQLFWQRDEAGVLLFVLVGWLVARGQGGRRCHRGGLGGVVAGTGRHDDSRKCFSKRLMFVFTREDCEFPAAFALLRLSCLE